MRLVGTRHSSSDSTSRSIVGSVGFAVLTCALFVELGGCIRGHERDQTAPPPVNTAAPAPVEGVHVTANDQAWPGDPSIRDHVTPVRLRLENNAAKPVRIEYKHLVLVDEEGTRLEALPLYRIEGSVPEQVILGDTVNRPLLVYDKYWLAPAYRDIYPGLSVYELPYPADAEYYNRYQTYWAERPLPTAEMRRYLLPEGVLDPGGSVEGFIYFKPSRTPESVYVMAQFRATDGQQIVAQARASLTRAPSS